MSRNRTPLLAAAGGVAAALGARLLLRRLLLTALRRSVRLLNLGDYRPMLARYADDAVLRFPDGDHRFAGEHRGRAAIERFLQQFTEVGLQGEVREVVTTGPPWRMTAFVRFDDRACDRDGAQLYANRAVLVLRTRRGRIVEHADYFEDTARIEELEQRLRALGR